MLRPKSPQASFYGSYIYDRIIPQDHLSGTSLVTSDNGTSLGTMKYYPFGGTRAGEVPTDIKFTGQRLDDTGLYYYNARYYDATIGRFISADIIIPNPANPQAFNRYTYCLNNPLKYVDPSGHWTLGWTLNIDVNLIFFKVQVNWTSVADNRGNIQPFTGSSVGLDLDLDGGFRLSGSASVGIEYTDAPTVMDLGIEERTGVEGYWEVGGYYENIQGLSGYSGWSSGLGLGCGAGVYSETTLNVPVTISGISNPDPQSMAIAVSDKTTIEIDPVIDIISYGDFTFYLTGTQGNNNGTINTSVSSTPSIMDRSTYNWAMYFLNMMQQ